MSKTLDTATVKTKSARRSQLFFLVLAALCFAIFAWLEVSQTTTYSLEANGSTYRLEVATTLAAQERGLGGRDGLAKDRGMLFSYQTARPHRCMWMKDMRFPIDMIWVDSLKRVVHVEQNVTPKTYPKSFCAPDPAQFILELPAGEARRAGIAVGKELRF